MPEPATKEELRKLDEKVEELHDKIGGDKVVWGDHGQQAVFEIGRTLLREYNVMYTGSINECITWIDGFLKGLKFAGDT